MRPTSRSTLTNAGSGGHVGSSYIAGWYGYVSKDLRRLLGQPVSDGFSRTYCGNGSLSDPFVVTLQNMS